MTRPRFAGFELSDKGISRLLLTILAFSISLPLRTSAIATSFSFVIFVIFAINDGKIQPGFAASPLVRLVVLQFIILIAGLLYTSDLGQGLLEVERSAFMISFLFLIFQARNSNVQVSELLLAFFFGCMCITLVGCGYTFFALNTNERQAVLQLGHTQFSDHISFHPTYLSVYLTFCFYFLIEMLRTKDGMLTTLSKGLIVSGLIYIVFMLIFLRSQMGLLTFAILLAIYCIIVFKKRAWLMTFILFTVAFLVFLLDQHRVSTFFDIYGKNVSSAVDQRVSVWRGTFAGIKKAPFFGAGTGGAQHLINLGYEKIGYQEGIDYSFNAHNQYFQFLIRNGIPELLVFLILLVYSFRRSLKMTNYTFLMFNMAVTMIMLTESFLNVQRGIVFFYFFVCAFVFLPFERTNEKNAYV